MKKSRRTKNQPEVASSESLPLSYHIQRAKVQLRSFGSYCLHQETLTRREVFIAIGILITCWLWVSWYLYIYNIHFAYGDSTFVAQIFHNYKSGFLMTSPYMDTISEVIKTVWYQPITTACFRPLVTSYTNTPVLIHLYLSGYLLIPLARIFPPDVLLAGAHAFFYFFVLGFGYLFARDRKLSVLHAGLLTILITQHPLWYTGIIGQFYFNRMFLVFCPIVIWLITRAKISYKLLIPAIILALMPNEIYGIVVFFILAGYAMITKKDRSKLIPLALASVGVSYVELKIIQQYNGNATTQTNYIQLLTSSGIAGFWTRIRDTVLDYKSFVYGFVNFSFLGALTVLKPILVLYLVLFLLPNLFVGIGGAEKTGWSTHYHVGYFVPMIWLSIWALAASKIRFLYKTIILISMIFYTSMINPIMPNLPIQPKPYIALKELFYNANFLISHRPYEYEYRTKFRALFQKRDSIVGPEAILYNLYNYHISLFPMNIDTADKVLLVYDPTKTGDDRFSSLAYGGEEAPGLAKCIIQRMHQDGYDFDNPTIFSPWAVISRKK